jgi:hypothetical protein
VRLNYDKTFKQAYTADAPHPSGLMIAKAFAKTGDVQWSG